MGPMGPRSSTSAMGRRADESVTSGADADRVRRGHWRSLAGRSRRDGANRGRWTTTFGLAHWPGSTGLEPQEYAPLRGGGTGEGGGGGGKTGLRQAESVHRPKADQWSPMVPDAPADSFRDDHDGGDVPPRSSSSSSKWWGLVLLVRGVRGPPRPAPHRAVGLQAVAPGRWAPAAPHDAAAAAVEELSVLGTG